MHVYRTLHLQREIATSVASSIVRTPPPPACLRTLTQDMKCGIFPLAATPQGKAALIELRAGLFTAAGQEREVLGLWRESVATSAYAELLAPTVGASIGDVALGGLLHRAGDAWILGALAHSEDASVGRLDGPSRSRLASLEGAACTERLARDWKLAPSLAACLTGWRRCGEGGAATAEAVAIYCGRLLALELLQPQFCVPSAIASALSEHGFDADTLARTRESDLRVLRLVRSL
jgi:HDOD domain